jgi:hypothetical protein
MYLFTVCMCFTVGVSKETVVQLAVQLKSVGDATVRMMGVYTERCRSILKYQVNWAAVVHASAAAAAATATATAAAAASSSIR